MTDVQDSQAWELIPLEGVGPLRFGVQTRDDVIALLGEPDEVLSREPVLVESYEEARVQPGYDANGRLVAVQLVDRRPLSYRGVGLTGRNVDAVRDDLRRLGVTDERSAQGYLVVPSLGLYFYDETSGSEPSIVVAVLAGNREYNAMMDALLEEYG